MLRDEPVSPVTPEEGFAKGMSLSAYMKLGHGREHAMRHRAFEALAMRELAASVQNPDAPATRGDIALLLAGLYAANRGYSMNHDAQRDANAALAGILALGGTDFPKRFY